MMTMITSACYLLQIETIKNFDGDKERLGNAEKFFAALLALPAYCLRVDGMMLKVEFVLTVDSLRPNIKAVKIACTGLLENKSLKEFLRFALHTGNFINGVSNIFSCSCYV